MSDANPAGAPGEGADSGGSLGRALDELYATLKDRQAEMPEGSYTARLLSDSEDTVLKKIGEEAVEVVMAAKDGDRAHLRYEIADLYYHLMVAMVRWDLTPADIASELESRRS